jgi:hypothetical protein
MGLRGGCGGAQRHVSGREALVDPRFPAGVVEQLQAYRHPIKVVDAEPAMNGNFSRPSAVVIEYDRGCMRAGVDVLRPALALK